MITLKFFLLTSSKDTRFLEINSFIHELGLNFSGKLEKTYQEGIRIYSFQFQDKNIEIHIIERCSVAYEYINKNHYALGVFNTHEECFMPHILQYFIDKYDESSYIKLSNETNNLTRPYLIKESNKCITIKRDEKVNLKIITLIKIYLNEISIKIHDSSVVEDQESNISRETIKLLPFSNIRFNKKTAENIEIEIKTNEEIEKSMKFSFYNKIVMVYINSEKKTKIMSIFSPEKKKKIEANFNYNKLWCNLIQEIEGTQIHQLYNETDLTLLSQSLINPIKKELTNTKTISEKNMEKILSNTFQLIRTHEFTPDEQVKAESIAKINKNIDYLDSIMHFPSSYKRVLICYRNLNKNSIYAWKISKKLIENKIDSRIDQYTIKTERSLGEWEREQIKKSHYVIYICSYSSEYYRKEENSGMGFDNENRLLENEIRTDKRNKKIFPIVTGEEDFTPDWLRPFPHYNVNEIDTIIAYIHEN